MPRWLSSLGPKTLIVLFAVATANTVLSYYVLQSVVQPAFGTIERHQADRDVGRVRAALEQERDHLVATSADWAVWDDSFAFVQGLKDDYVEENILPTVFQNLKLSYLAFLAPDGSTVFDAAVNPESGEPLDSTALDTAALRAALPATSPRTADDILAGLVELDGQILLVARHPVVDTLAEQPPAGSLIMARPVDARLLATLRDQTGVDFRLLPLSQADLAALPDALQALIGSPGGRTDVVQSVADGRLIAQGVIDALDGEPAVVAEISREREISAAGQETTGLAILLMVLTAIAHLVVVWLLLSRLVLRPIRRLTRHIQSARSQDAAEPPPPLNWRRDDELGVLADTYDRLNAALARQVSDLNHALERLHAADAAKSAFFANMSHELRTPLNAIIGFSDLLATQPFGTLPDPRYVEYVGDIHTSGHHLLDLVNQILEYAKADSQQLQIATESLDVATVINETVRMVRMQANQDRIAIRLDVEPDLPPLMSDKLRLSQILLNLLSNAVKYTDPGGSVTVRARHAGGCIELLVTDTGIGMSPEEIPRALAPFVQLPNKGRAAASGTGLGLPLAKRLTELLGGRFHLSSAPGQGTTAAITLPLAAQPAAPAGGAELQLLPPAS